MDRRTGSGLTIIIFCLCIPMLVNAMSYTRVIAFGDSLTDMGNNTWMVDDFRFEHATVGAPVTNRLPNGVRDVWLQYLLKDPVFAKRFQYPALVPSRLMSDKETSVNYAFAPALTVNAYTVKGGLVNAGCTAPGWRCIPGLLKQVRLYLASGRVDRDALYFIWAGGNDFIDDWVLMYYMLIDPSRWKTYLSNLSLTPTHNIVKAVRLLERAGVASNHIVVMNLPDISLTPAAKSMLKNDRLSYRLLNGMVRLFNANLAFRLKLLEWQTGKHVIVIDTYHLLAHWYHATPPKFQYLSEQCVQNKRDFYAGCQGYLFYNSKHPTTQVHEQFAQQVMSEILETSR